MDLTEDQRIELINLRAELHRAEARIVAALAEVPPGHPLEGAPLVDFHEADEEIKALRARIKILEDLHDR